MRYISNGLARTFWSDGSVGHYGEVTNHLMTRHLMGYKHKTYGGHITGYIYNGLVRRLWSSGVHIYGWSDGTNEKINLLVAYCVLFNCFLSDGPWGKQNRVRCVVCGAVWCVVW